LGVGGVAITHLPPAGISRLLDGLTPYLCLYQKGDESLEGVHLKLARTKKGCCDEQDASSPAPKALMPSPSRTTPNSTVYLQSGDNLHRLLNIAVCRRLPQVILVLLLGLASPSRVCRLGRLEQASAEIYHLALQGSEFHTPSGGDFLPHHGGADWDA